MTAQKVTSQQVAARAGVSQSAVSRVFTPGASASKKTVERVRQASTELGYRPNVLARSLITGRSRIIGLVVAYLDNQFYPETLQLLSNALQKKGYHVLIFMASQTTGDIDDVVDELLDYQVDGIIAASVALSSDLAARCRAAGKPVVLFNRMQDDKRLSSVSSDNIAGGEKVANFLLDGGHQRIAYIAGWEGASTQRDREAGFCAALKQRGAALFARDVGDFNLAATRAAARRMFSQSTLPDAVFVANDHMAFQVLDVMRYEFGVKVPEDVAVVGYDDVPLAAWPAYNLTTVRQRANQMVEETVAILMNCIDDGSDDRTIEPQRKVIDGPLVVRGSTRLPKS